VNIWRYINLDLIWFDEKRPWTLVNKQKSYWRAYWSTQVGDYISALMGWCALNFLYALEIAENLLTHTKLGRGSSPPQRNYENLKFGLKFSVCAPITSGIVGIFSTNFSRPRDELWSTNEKVIARKSYNCSYTVSWSRKSIRHVVLFESFISCHCCERNFNYLNWLSTRICGAGRPHVWLCHARLVNFTNVLYFLSHTILVKNKNVYSHFTIFTFYRQPHPTYLCNSAGKWKRFLST